jgi:hypothetical protein
MSQLWRLISYFTFWSIKGQLFIMNKQIISVWHVIKRWNFNHLQVWKNKYSVCAMNGFFGVFLDLNSMWLINQQIFRIPRNTENTTKYKIHFMIDSHSYNYLKRDYINMWSNSNITFVLSDISNKIWIWVKSFCDI